MLVLAAMIAGSALKWQLNPDQPWTPATHRPRSENLWLRWTHEVVLISDSFLLALIPGEKNYRPYQLAKAYCAALCADRFGLLLWRGVVAGLARN